MLPGFPKTITTKRIRRGLYRVTRSDGREYEIVHGVGRWMIKGTGEDAKTLGELKFDIRMGYLPLDQAAARQGSADQ